MSFPGKFPDFYFPLTSQILAKFLGWGVAVGYTHSGCIGLGARSLFFALYPNNMLVVYHKNKFSCCDL